MCNFNGHRFILPFKCESFNFHVRKKARTGRGEKGYVNLLDSNQRLFFYKAFK